MKITIKTEKGNFLMDYSYEEGLNRIVVTDTDSDVEVYNNHGVVLHILLAQVIELIGKILSSSIHNVEIFTEDSQVNFGIINALAMFLNNRTFIQ